MSESPTHPLTILIVDDNRELLEILAESLESLGAFRAVTTPNGSVALERVTQIHPDCIVIDVMMPVLDGMQLARALRGDPATASIPLIMLTAMAQDKDRFAGLASGADQYLVKPTKPLDLIAAIQMALRQSAAERKERMRQLADEPNRH